MQKHSFCTPSTSHLQIRYNQKILIPGHQDFVLLRAEIMPVFDHKKVFGGLSDLSVTGHHAFGENISSWE